MDTLPPMPASTSAIEARIAALKAEVKELKRSNTNSPKFWTRALAIVGHQFAVSHWHFLPCAVRHRARGYGGRQQLTGALRVRKCQPSSIRPVRHRLPSTLNRAGPYDSDGGSSRQSLVELTSPTTAMGSHLLEGDERLLKERAIHGLPAPR